MRDRNSIAKFKPVKLTGYRVSLNWFNFLMSETEVDAEFNAVAEYGADGKILPGLSRLEVCEGGDILALFDDGDIHHVTIVTKAPTEAMQLEAKRVIAESGF